MKEFVGWKKLSIGWWRISIREQNESLNQSVRGEKRKTSLENQFDELILFPRPSQRHEFSSPQLYVFQSRQREQERREKKRRIEPWEDEEEGEKKMTNSKKTFLEDDDHSQAAYALALNEWLKFNAG